MLGGKICHWLLLFQELEFDIIVKPGRLIVGPDHLSWLVTREDPTNLDDNLLNAQLSIVKMVNEYYQYIIHFMTTRNTPDGYNTIQKKQLVVKYGYF